MPEKMIRRAPAPAPVKSVAKKVPGGGGVARPNGAPAPVAGATKKMVARPPAAAAPAPAPAPARPVKKMAPTKQAAPRVAAGEDEDEAEDLREALRSGWTAAQETIDSTSTWAVTFKPATQTQIVKFLQQTPYASFRRHWIQRVNGRRAYTCLQSFNRDCPLCDVGDRASAVSAFNIAVCGDDGEATLRSWDCGVRLTQTLKTFANDQKVGPLDKRSLYFAVSKTESTNRQQASTLVTPARERDLLEDYGIPPLDDDDIEKLLAKAYANDVIQMNSHKELQQVADEIMNEEPGSAGQSSGWGSS